MTVRSLLSILVAAISLGIVAAPAQAIPAFSRMYDVPCMTCHTVAPNLNATGRTFQANFFRWAAETAPTRQRGILATPVSGIVTADVVRNTTRRVTSRYQFETLELYAADSFTLNKQRNGGFFIQDVAAIREGKSGILGNAWVAVPVAGKNGQVAVTAGQFSPMMYQYDPLNSLTNSLPVGLSLGSNGIAFTAATPGVRVDYFDNRGKGTADGTYVSGGVAFGGNLTLNSDSRLYEPRGTFLHGFRRQGKGSVGAFGYASGGRYQIGLLGTFEILPELNLMAAAATARDEFSGRGLSSKGYSLEANWAIKPNLALTGRLESTSGIVKETYPVAAVTYYPFTLSVLRISVETIQQKSNRQIGLYTYLLF